MNWKLKLCTLLAALALSACSADHQLATGPSFEVVHHVASVTVTPSKVSVTPGTTAQLAAVVKDVQGAILTGRTVTWTTSAPAIAMVSGGGIVTGVAAGVATITATSGGKSGSAAVTVTVPVASVTISPANLSLTVGGTSQLSVVLKDASGNVLTGQTVSWTTSAPAVAIVTGSGVVTGTAPGTATVTATSGTRFGNATITVGTTTAFPSADVLRDASFETTFDGFVNWSYGTPTNVNRDTTHAYAGSVAVRKILPNTVGIGDQGSQFGYPFARIGLGTYDRLWTRFYFYLDANIDGGMKLVRWFDSGLNTQFSGLGIQNGAINARFDPEAGSGGTPLQINIASIAGLTKGWHSLELDYWRNGDTSNGGNDYPSMAFWLDGVQITRQSSGSLVAPSAWIGGRYNAGKRSSTTKLGFMELLGLMNGGINSTANTIPGNIWVDRVAISSLGRIGQ